MNEKLKEFIKKSNLTKTEIAKRSGITMMSLYRYEQGRRTPSIDTAARIADVLGTSVEKLWGIK